MTEREKIVKIIQSVERLHARYIHCIDHNDDIQLVTREEAIADALLERSRKSIGGNEMTNYERIKNMNLEEMAEFLCRQSDCYNCPAYIIGGMCDTENTYMKKWLRSQY